MGYIFRMKFTPEEVVKILVQHLIVEGQITEKEGQLVKELSKAGRSYLLEFETPVIPQKDE